MKSLTYFRIKTKILVDFQICISVPLIKNFCKLSSVCETKIPFLKWDIENERNPILGYVEFKTYQGHKDFQTTECGLYPNQKNSFLGASPDGIAKCSGLEAKHLIEVKCPNSKKMCCAWSMQLLTLF